MGFKEAYIRVLLELRLDESQQVLLVHTRRVMNMGIDLSDIVEITTEVSPSCLPFEFV